MKQNLLKIKKLRLYVGIISLIILLPVIAFGVVRRADLMSARSIDFIFYKNPSQNNYLAGWTSYYSKPEKSFNDIYPGTWQVTTFYKGDITSKNNFDPLQEDPSFEINQHKVGTVNLRIETCGSDTDTVSCKVVGKNSQGGDIFALNYDEQEGIQGLQTFYGTDLGKTRVNIYAGEDTLSSAKVVELYKGMMPTNKYLLRFETRHYID
jgi:hypothetical protein